MITDFAIEPLPGQLSLLRGYMGITKELALKGSVVFKATRAISVVELSLDLYGCIRTRLSAPDSIYSAEKPLVTSSLKIIDTVGGTVSTAEGVGTVSLPAGEHRFSFEIAIPEEVVKTLPASHENIFIPPARLNPSTHVAERTNSLIRRSSSDQETPDWNGAVILYQLTASLTTLSAVSMGTLAKTRKVVEKIDFPRIDPAGVALSVVPELPPRSMTGTDEYLDYHIDIDRSVFGLGQPLTVQLHYLRPIIPDLIITSVNVTLLQVCTIRAISERGNQEDDTVHTEANPDTKKKSVRVKQRVIRSILQTVPIRQPVKGFKHFINQMTSKTETWSGGAMILLTDSKIRLRKKQPPSSDGKANIGAGETGTFGRRQNDAIEAFSSFESELVSVSHIVEIRVRTQSRSLSNPEILVYEFPIQFIDCDDEARGFILNRRTKSALLTHINTKKQLSFNSSRRVSSHPRISIRTNDDLKRLSLSSSISVNSSASNYKPSPLQNDISRTVSLSTTPPPAQQTYPVSILKKRMNNEPISEEDEDGEVVLPIPPGQSSRHHLGHEENKIGSSRAA